MRIPIFYFSGTGNTWFVTQEIANQLKDLGHDVSVHAIESDDVKNPTSLYKLIETADIMGIGYPIYGSNLPKIIKNFLLNLPDTEDKVVFGYCTQMTISGNGGAFINEYIKDKGYELKWASYIVMPSNLEFPPLVIFKIPTRRRIINILKEAKEKIEIFTEHIHNNDPWIEDQTVIDKFYTTVSRPIFSIEFPEYRKLAYVDMTKCTKCNLCIELCPTNSMEYINGKINIDESCIFCLRCYSFCPHKAINLDFNMFNTKNYKRYKGPIPRFNPRLLKE